MKKKNKFAFQFSITFLLLAGDLGEAGSAGGDGGLLVVLADLAGVLDLGKPRAALLHEEAERSGALHAVLVVLARLVGVGVVLRLGHCECVSEVSFFKK